MHFPAKFLHPCLRVLILGDIPGESKFKVISVSVILRSQSKDLDPQETEAVSASVFSFSCSCFPILVSNAKRPVYTFDKRCLVLNITIDIKRIELGAFLLYPAVFSYSFRVCSEIIPE